MQENLGLKTYEYTNHLGNVLLTTNDKRLPIDNNADNIIDAYSADMRSYSDYYPYGMLMVGRNSNISDYRFGMNGMEMDNEASGNGNSYTTFFRMYDARLGRWASIDPIVHPWQSPYNAFDANPIYYADPSGADGEPPTAGTSKPTPENPGKNGEIGGSGTKLDGYELPAVEIEATMPSLGDMIKSKLEIADSHMNKWLEFFKGSGKGKDPSKLAVHIWGQCDQDPGTFKRYKNDKYVTTEAGMEIVESIAFAYNQMGYKQMNWRDQAKKYVTDSKNLKQINKAMGDLNGIRSDYQNGNYAQATNKLIKWQQSEGGKLVIQLAMDFADSPEAQNANPVLSQPSAEEVQQFFEENFEVINNTESIEFDVEGDSATHSYSMGRDSIKSVRVTKKVGRMFQRQGARVIK